MPTIPLPHTLILFYAAGFMTAWWVDRQARGVVLSIQMAWLEPNYSPNGIWLA